jgi:hypothetical protein
MVARGSLNAPTVLTRGRGFAIGVIAAVPPAGLALLVFLGSSPWFGFTLTVACLGSGAVIGATIGRGLAAKLHSVGVLVVTAIAVIIGDFFAAPILALNTPVSDPIAFFVGGLAVFGIPAYFFLAFPGLVLGILLARRMASDTK